MKKRFLIKKAAAIIIAAAIAAVPTFTVCADSTTTDTGAGTAAGSVGINGTILPLTISVTHQLNLSYTINPNNGSITSTPISITNNTKVPVMVTVESLSSAPGGSLDFQDVLPSAKNWPSLSLDESKRFIALGVRIEDSTGWNSGYNTATDWAAANTATVFGSINTGTTGKLQLVADSGLTFDNTYTANAGVVLVVSLV